MDQTTIPPAAPKPVETGLQTGLPPIGANGTHTEAPTMKAKGRPMHPVRYTLECLADLRITVVLFVLALLIVFWGTLAQVDNGVWTVVKHYFRSALILVPLKVVLFNAVDETKIVVPFPGGWLVGGAMLINLLAAHAIRFKLAWSRAGIILIHAGVIVIMLGELITGIYAMEGQMVIPTGQTVNQVIHPGTAEFVVIRNLNEKDDEVVSIPKGRLKVGSVIEDANLPFKVEVTQYMVNSDYKGIAPPDQADPDARGHARIFAAFEVPEVSGVDTNQRHDAPSMVAKLTDRNGKSLGTWLFSAHLENQWIKIDGKEYQLALRFKQTKRDFSFQLTEFKHDVFPGTMTPKDFHSYIRLVDKETGMDRPVEIYMNAPLYYRGETFYQSSWTTDKMTKKANGTVLQVVSNPGWLMPYIACLLVGLGMLVHFGNTLYKFVGRRIIV
jgi:hypothetical protein